MTGWNAWIGAGDAALDPSDDLSVALKLIRGVDTDDPTVESHREAIVAMADRSAALATRTTRPGHLTGSALVMDADGERVLVLLHRKLGIWVQPGGHADGDMNLIGVAWREASEETGIAGLRIDPVPIDLDVHQVAPPAEDAHLHLDVRFLVVAPLGAEPQGNHESDAIRWVTPGELTDLGADAGLLRLAAAGRDRWAGR